MNNNNEIMYFNDMEQTSQYIQTLKSIPSRKWVSVPYEVASICSPEASILYGNILGFISGLYQGTNTALADLMHCSTRTIARLINELKEKECIKVVVVNRTTRLIYPLYTMPFIYKIDNEKKKESDKDNGGILEL